MNKSGSYFVWLVLLFLLCAVSSWADEDASAGLSRAVPANEVQPVLGLVKKDSERRVALVIGNADYVRVPKLDNPVNDARDTCKALQNLGFETQCFENLATRRDMKNALPQRFRRLH